MTGKECHHRNVSERPKYAIDDPPGHWLCLDCGDTFPLIGDTDEWAPTTTRIDGLGFIGPRRLFAPGT